MKTTRYSPSPLHAIVCVFLCLIRFSLPAAGQSLAESVYAGTSPESAPKHWLESITHADQSSSRLLVFQTVPGVNYRVESSKDLKNWTETGSYTGGGQQVLVPMVQMKAPPVPEPPPADPPPPVIHTWLMMQKATAGGIVLYWHSMSRGPDERVHLSFQSHHFSNLTLDPAWEEYFIYVRKFGASAFSITHPRSLSVAPPDTEHSAEDLAMLAVFEANFGTMDAEVRDHIAEVRYIPPPAPPSDSSGRGFFRIWADWSADSDWDTVPDWEEFAMIAGVAGVGEDGKFAMSGTPDPLADPFNGDANNNGIPDGEELDFDKDQLPDSKDAAPKDGVIAWRKTRPTRYALFNVALAENSDGSPIWPISVNSQGMVLFKDGVYYGDSFRDLPYAEGMLYGRAHAINDAGKILGEVSFNDEEWEPDQAIWSSPTGQPARVAKDVMKATSTYDMLYGLLAFGSAFGNDGSCVSETYEYVTDENGSYYDYIDPEVWTVAENGAVSHGQTGTISTYCKSKDIHWGWNSDDHLILTAPQGGGNLGKVGFDKYNLVDGRQAVMTGGRTSAVFRVNNEWKRSGTLGNVLNISDTGIAHVKKAPNAEKIPEGLGFWMNNKFLHLKTIVPDLPDDYKSSSTVEVRGMADKGQIVLTMDPGDPYSEAAKCAVGFPCAIEDDTAESVRLAYRDSDSDTVPFTGVDDVSITANKPDAAADNKIWIMAPIGSEARSNDVKPRIPVSTDNPLTLKGDNLDGEKTVTLDGQQISLRGSGAATSDKDLTLKLATNTALNAPIGAKAMNRRKVRVTLTPVAIATPHNHPEPYPPSSERPAPKQQPAKDRLEKFLNKIYQLQLNAEIELTVKPQVTLDFSVWERGTFLPCMNKLETLPEKGDFTFDASTSDEHPSVEELAFVPLRDPGADINVYLLAGTGISTWTSYNDPKNPAQSWIGGAAWGIAKRNTREAWVDGDMLTGTTFGWGEGDQLTKQVMHTVAHEMGHIIVGKGHPDDGETGHNGGPAPLPGTYHHDRLMVAGGGSLRAILPGGRLVKGEWDAAETWFISRNK